MKMSRAGQPWRAFLEATQRWPLLAAMLAAALAGCAMPESQTAESAEAAAVDATLQPGVATAGNRAAMTIHPQTTATTASPAAAQSPGATAPAPATATITPSDAALLLQQGEAALVAGDRRTAIDSFTVVLQGDPHNSQALMGMGESYLAMRDPKKALEAFEQVDQGVPDLQARALQGEGLALSAMGQREEGQRRLLEALKMDPGLWRAWNAVGVNYDGMRAWEDARSSYEKAAAASPSAAAAVRNNEAMSLLLQGKKDQAEAAFQDALNLDPRSPLIRANLRILLASEGRYDEALAAIPSNQLPTALNNVGYMAMKRGDYAAAQKFLTQAMQSSPAYYEKAARNLAYVEYLMSRPAAKQSAGAKAE